MRQAKIVTEQDFSIFRNLLDKSRAAPTWDGSFSYFLRSQAKKPGFFGSAEGSGTAASASTVPVLSGICSSVPVAYRFEKDGYYRESRMNLKP